MKVRRMGEKHGARLGSLSKRMQLKGSLLIKHAAALHRNGRPLAAAFYVMAGLAVYPVRNAAFFRTLWRAAHERIVR
jgi:hypothetical protein